MKTFLIILVVILVLGFGGFYGWTKYANKSAPASSTTSSLPTMTGEIPDSILENKFGFLGAGDVESVSQVKEYGAVWVRPHPGPFLWDAMQKESNEKISFENTDVLVQAAGKAQVGILATLWPFADFDQQAKDDLEKCKVSANDEFLSQNDKKGRGDYLPPYRCNPQDWTKYEDWVKAVVKRYDGDGISDMPDLKIPIKYYEVANEPDLSGTPDDRLDFYKEDAAGYGTLLVKTATAIHQADSDSKVLIAGAAGGNEEFLNFYRQVFQNKETLSAFDIGNVHCISNDQNNDFNVSLYKKMLEEFGLTPDIWVTEAENMKGTTLQENADLTKQSTQGAISAGAKKIFYTRYNFEDFRTDMSEKNQESEASIQESQRLYKEIIESN